jgi:hypothetical protein
MMHVLVFLATVPVIVLFVVFLLARRACKAEEQLALELLCLIKDEELRREDERRLAGNNTVSTFVK